MDKLLNQIHIGCAAAALAAVVIGVSIVGRPAAMLEWQPSASIEAARLVAERRLLEKELRRQRGLFEAGRINVARWAVVRERIARRLAGAKTDSPASSTGR